MSRVIVEDAERQCFVRIRPDDPGKKCIASVTVDDVLVVSKDQDLVDILFTALAARFGPLTQHAVSTLHTGLEITRHTNGAVSLTQDNAIARAASVVGVSHLSSVSLPGY